MNTALSLIDFIDLAYSHSRHGLKALDLAFEWISPREVQVIEEFIASHGGIGVVQSVCWDYYMRMFGTVITSRTDYSRPEIPTTYALYQMVFHGQVVYAIRSFEWACRKTSLYRITYLGVGMANALETLKTNPQGVATFMYGVCLNYADSPEREIEEALAIARWEAYYDIE